MTMNKLFQRGVLSVAGLAAAAGIAAGPGVGLSQDNNNMPTVDVGPVAATQQRVPVEALMPDGVPAGQSTIALSGEQEDNARAIVEATKKAGMDQRAAVIAVATSLQESKLENLGHLGDRNDHDSQGLFQQRPSSGWGTVEQITDPRYATTAFLTSLKQVHGWRDMPLTDAAQKVQVSAFPDAYAQWEKQAADLVAEHWS